MNSRLLLYEEVMLLAIHDDNGAFSGGMYLYGVAGAVLSELLLQQKIAVVDGKKGKISVVDNSTTGDAILDDVLKLIGDSSKQRKLEHWVSRVADLPDLKHRIARQLCDRGILQQDESKVLWIFTKKVYPELDGSHEEAIRHRMAEAMFDESVKPDPPTAVLIALAHHAGLLKANFAPDELRQHKDRIKQIAEGELLAAEATQSAIQAVQTAIMLAAILPAVTVATTTHH